MIAEPENPSCFEVPSHNPVLTKPPSNFLEVPVAKAKASSAGAGKLVISAHEPEAPEGK